jgi:hypothetical protein
MHQSISGKLVGTVLLILGFNLRAHHWGFFWFFIHPLPVLARSASFWTNSCSFSFYQQSIQLDLDLVGHHPHSWSKSIRVLTSWSADSANSSIYILALQLLSSLSILLLCIGRLADTRTIEGPSVLLPILNIFHCQSTGQICWHASLQTGESRVSHAEVTSYFHVNKNTIFHIHELQVSKCRTINMKMRLCPFILTSWSLANSLQCKL